MQKSKAYDLKKRTFIFSLEVIGLLEKLPRDYISYTIGKQLLRAATSIGTNIVEAFAASSKKDFAYYYNIALKSANETKYWLCLLKSSNRGEANKIDKLLLEVSEIGKILAKSLITMRGK